MHLAPNNYTVVPITGGDSSKMLTSDTRDVDGDIIRSGGKYRVFVLSVGGGVSNGTNALSLPSSAVMLSNSTASTITSLSVTDVSDLNNAQDLQVSFTRASDESYIDHYRIFVVRDTQVNNFNLAAANAVLHSNFYTTVFKTGGNINQTLTWGTRDAYGSQIQNGYSYRIFVMSVSKGAWQVPMHCHPLLKLSHCLTIVCSAVMNPTVSDVSDFNNGQDLRVSFTKPWDENNINHYRIFIVKDANTASFNLATANAITNSSYYTIIPKTGNNINQLLSAGTLDVNGATIQSNIAYRIFVLSVANGNTSNALSSPTNSISLTTNPQPNVPAPIVQNVSAQQIGTINQLVGVSFSPPANENGVDHYAVMVVPEAAGTLTEEVAIQYYTNGRYTRVERATGYSTLTTASVDVNSVPLVFGIQYQVYVLSVADGLTATQSKLSSSMASIKLAQ